MTTTKSSLRDVLEALKNGQSFVLAAHVNPDGDAIGSMLSLAALLKSMGKDAVCVTDELPPGDLGFLPGINTILSPAQAAKRSYDTAIILDVSTLDRAGKSAQAFPKHAPLIVIDHHIEPAPEGQLNFVDTSYAATAEIVLELFDLAGVSLSYEVALCAYTAIVTDTGGFKYPSTTGRTHRLTARLLDEGIDPGEIAGRVFDSMSLGRFRLITRAFSKLTLTGNGRIAYTVVTGQDMDETGAKSEDLNNLGNHGRNIEGVDVSVVFRELEPRRTKVSFRSQKTFNSAECLQHFGGGGHTGAAAAVVDLPLDETVRNVLTHVRACMGLEQ